MQPNKKKIAGVIAIAVLLVLIWPVSRLFLSSPQNTRKTVQFIRSGKQVDLSKFASQVEQEPGQPAVVRQPVVTPEMIEAEFYSYISSPALPHLPLIEKPAYNKPSVATASGKVAVAATGNTVRRSRGAAAPARRGSRHSFGSEAAPAVLAGTTGNSAQFPAKLFGDVLLQLETPVQIQVLESFRVKGCEIKKNTIITALAKPNGRRVELTVTGLPACGEMLSCRFAAYDSGGLRGLYAVLPGAGQGGAQAAAGTARREAVQTANGLLSTYGGAVGRVIGAGLSDAVSSAGTTNNAILLTEGTRMVFKAE